MFPELVQRPMTPEEGRYATLRETRAACRKIARHWSDQVVEDARILIMASPWDVTFVDRNELVATVQDAILAHDLEPVAEVIVAVLAWTGGYLPDSWLSALNKIPGAEEQRLSAIFGDFENPWRNPF